LSWEEPPTVRLSIDVTWSDESSPEITVSWDEPPTVNVTWDELPSLMIGWEEPPLLVVSWDTPPTISCDCTFTISVTCASAAALYSNSAATSAAVNLVGDDFVDKDFDDLFGQYKGIKANADDAQVDMDLTGLGIPSEIKVIAPVFPKIKIDHDLPRAIQLEVPEIPNIEMKWAGPNLPKQIEIVPAANIPSYFELIGKDIPEAIKLDASSVPDAIQLIAPKDFPSILTIDGQNIPEFIQVRGIPDSIEVKMPSEIIARLEIPENLEIPLVYKDKPIPVQFDTSNLLGDESEHPCFALVPCNPKK